MNQYKTTFETWDKLALAYQDKFMNMDLYNDTYDLFCVHIEKPDAAIFEIGCGPGNITKYLLSKRPNYKIDAIDVAPSMVALAKTNNPKANFSVFDCREIDKLTTKYDGIICGFCMPYLSKPNVAKLINDCSLLLESKGVLYFSAIEDDYNKSDLETSSNGLHSMFVYYHEADYLEQQLTKYNFKLVHLIRKMYLKSGGKNATHIIVLAEKL